MAPTLFLLIDVVDPKYMYLGTNGCHSFSGITSQPGAKLVDPTGR